MGLLINVLVSFFAIACFRLIIFLWGEPQPYLLHVALFPRLLNSPNKFFIKLTLEHCLALNGWLLLKPYLSKDILEAPLHGEVIKIAIFILITLRFHNQLLFRLSNARKLIHHMCLLLLRHILFNQVLLRLHSVKLL